LKLVAAFENSQPRTPSAQDKVKAVAEMAEASAILQKVAGGLPSDLRQQIKTLNADWQEGFSSLLGGVPSLASYIDDVGALEQKILNLPPGDPALGASRLGMLR
jgi:hypothetical protein